ncbi:TetR/AcrR family transcriptional regulator [Albibacillus kandeliae]|jgi:AcrR family transcriptional regulator|uniref:TetR/AcrR family transcriptional regulator n=1 Tax=Albibacillus kandeliae TaxID=2174228 RepID=UPI000D689678|nr:TetR/AcrR family transcriptional regulator [Albibacillus kandeliae]
MNQDTLPRPGRPRSAASRARALEAARTILMRDGMGKLTVEAVSAASGTGKPTIYRHWSNAQELAMEALISDTEEMPETRGAPRAALIRQLDRLITAFGTTRGRQITLALASADPGSELTRAFRNRVILAARQDGREMIETFISLGRLQPPPDMEVLLDMIYGPLFFRLLVGHQPLDKELPSAIIETAFAILSPSAP